MTRNSIKEYSEAIKVRYRKATKEEKGRILDEFTKTSGLHRKASIRLLNRCKPGIREEAEWTAEVVRIYSRRSIESRMGGIGSSLLEAASSVFTGVHKCDAPVWRKQDGHRNREPTLPYECSDY